MAGKRNAVKAARCVWEKVVTALMEYLREWLPISLNQVRYEVYKHHIKNHDVVIYYAEDSTKSFEKIEMTQTGHFARKNKEASGNFPTGFFNSTLKELLEIG